MGHNDLGDLFYQRGDLGQALKAYVRTRDYCSTSKHMLSMCLNIIRVSVEQNNWTYVQNYVQKAETTLAHDITQQSATAGGGAASASVGHLHESANTTDIGRLRAADGLAKLEAGKYKLAARKFIAVPIELGGKWNDVISLTGAA